MDIGINLRQLPNEAVTTWKGIPFLCISIVALRPTNVADLLSRASKIKAGLQRFGRVNRTCLLGTCKAVEQRELA